MNKYINIVIISLISILILYSCDSNATAPNEIGVQSNPQITEEDINIIMKEYYEKYSDENLLEDRSLSKAAAAQSNDYGAYVVQQWPYNRLYWNSNLYWDDMEVWRSKALIWVNAGVIIEMQPFTLQATIPVQTGYFYEFAPENGVVFTSTQYYPYTSGQYYKWVYVYKIRPRLGSQIGEFSPWLI